MKERPIIFSAESIKGILEDRKTQTRRVIKPEWSRCLDLDEPEDIQKAIDLCPYGQPGDHLWVRETWAASPFLNTQKPSILDPQKVKIFYQKDWPEVNQSHYMWRSPIFMPRWASRINLEIISVKVEQLQKISIEDAEAEGFYCGDQNYADVFPFIEAWNRINLKRGYSWLSNPWVWVIKFKKIEPSPIER